MNRERRSSLTAFLGMAVSSEDRRLFLVDHQVEGMDRVLGSLLLPPIMKTKNDVRKCLNRYYGPPIGVYPFRILQAFVDYAVWSRKSDYETDEIKDPYSVKTDLEELEQDFQSLSAAFAFVRYTRGLGPSQVIEMEYPPKWVLDNDLRVIRPFRGGGARLHNATAADEARPRPISLRMSMSDKDPGAFGFEDVNEHGLRRAGSLNDLPLHLTDAPEVRVQREVAPSAPLSPLRWQMTLTDPSTTDLPNTHFPSPPASPPSQERSAESHNPDWTLDLDRQLSLRTAESSEYSPIDTPIDGVDVLAARTLISNSLSRTPVLPSGAAAPATTIATLAATPVAAPAAAPTAAPAAAPAPGPAPKATRNPSWVTSSLNRYVLQRDHLNRTRTEPGTSERAIGSSHRLSRSLTGLINKIPVPTKADRTPSPAPEVGEADLAPLSPNLTQALSLPRSRDGHKRSTSNLHKPTPPAGAVVATAEFGL